MIILVIALQTNANIIFRAKTWHNTMTKNTYLSK